MKRMKTLLSAMSLIIISTCSAFQVSKKGVSILVQDQFDYFMDSMPEEHNMKTESLVSWGKLYPFKITIENRSDREYVFNQEMLSLSPDLNYSYWKKQLWGKNGKIFCIGSGALLVLIGTAAGSKVPFKGISIMAGLGLLANSYFFSKEMQKSRQAWIDKNCISAAGLEILPQEKKSFYIFLKKDDYGKDFVLLLKDIQNRKLIDFEISLAR